MPGGPMSDGMYDEIVRFYREHPGKMSRCARRLNISYATAKRAWLGPPWLSGRKTAQQILDEEAAARSPAVTERDLARQTVIGEKERMHKMERAAREFEEEALERTRNLLLDSTKALSSITKGVSVLCNRVDGALQTQEFEVGPQSLADFIEMLRKYVNSVSTLTKSVDALVHLGRLQRELPSSIMGLKPMTPDEAAQAVEKANDAMRRVRAMTPGLTALPGGKG